MDKVCDYCDAQYDDSLDTCPHCGAANSHVRRGDGVPRTIEELKNWYRQMNFPPPETTRFFIGTDYKQPRAFGIYKDGRTGDFVVYKNKADGSRAERYRGGDESYAVNELYLKLKEEASYNKSRKIASNTYKHPQTRSYNIKKKTTNPKALVLVIIFFVIMIISTATAANDKSMGYYDINGNSYYTRDNDWYYWNGSDWDKTEKPYVDGDIEDYYSSYSWSSGNDYSDFNNSSWYEDYTYSSYSSSSSSSSSSWWDDDDDYGSWDSGSSWDSWDSGSSWDSGGSWDSDW